MVGLTAFFFGITWNYYWVFYYSGIPNLSKRLRCGWVEGRGYAYDL